jgi:glyoxylase-like metal-dependent hydrolase (beta-lactamase superfamily II)
VIHRIELGRFRLYSLLDGSFRLDGGAMFGVVPRTLWSKSYAPDDRHRIELAIRPLLVEAGSKWILIDTGMGDKFNEKLKSIYGIEEHSKLEHELAEMGLSTSDIDMVINTHLHWDHAGGNTRRDASTGKWIPNFPNARYIVQRGEYEFATHVNERTRGSYRFDDYVALEEQGYFDFVDGDFLVTNGVRVIRSGGHVPYHQCVLLESNKTKAFYLGDLIPTHAHLPHPYITGYDIEPLVTLEKKKEFLSKAHEEDWLLFFGHDPKIAYTKIKLEGKSYEIRNGES